MEIKNVESQGFDFSGGFFMEKFKLFLNYKLLLDMEQECAKINNALSNAFSNPEPVN